MPYIGPRKCLCFLVARLYDKLFTGASRLVGGGEKGVALRRAMLLHTSLLPPPAMPERATTSVAAFVSELLWHRAVHVARAIKRKVLITPNSNEKAYY